MCWWPARTHEPLCDAHEDKLGAAIPSGKSQSGHGYPRDTVICDSVISCLDRPHSSVPRSAACWSCLGPSTGANADYFWMYCKLALIVVCNLLRSLVNLRSLIGFCLFSHLSPKAAASARPAGSPFLGNCNTVSDIMAYEDDRQFASLPIDCGDCLGHELRFPAL
jgi:hypothetical protein